MRSTPIPRSTRPWVRLYGRLERTGHQFPVTGAILCLGDSPDLWLRPPAATGLDGAVPPRPRAKLLGGGVNGNTTGGMLAVLPDLLVGSTRTRSS
ncbi:MAG: hypothetical protein ACLT5P_08805 [Flavonifractor plautii]